MSGREEEVDEAPADEDDGPLPGRRGIVILVRRLERADDAVFGKIVKKLVHSIKVDEIVCTDVAIIINAIVVA